MTLHNIFRPTRPSRLARVTAAVVAVVALAAASCGGSADVDELPPDGDAAPPSTSAPSTSEPAVHPCDLDTAHVVDGFCLDDGQWWSDAGSGNWAESDGPPATTTVAPATTVAAAPATTTPPEEAPSACDDPDAEDLGGGIYALNDRLYLLIDGRCLAQSDQPTGDASTEPAAPTTALGPECPEYDHRHTPEGSCHHQADILGSHRLRASTTPATECVSQTAPYTVSQNRTSGCMSIRPNPTWSWNPESWTTPTRSATIRHATMWPAATAP